MSGLLVIPAKAGIQSFQSILGSRSPPSRGQVYPCENRAGSDSLLSFSATCHKIEWGISYGITHPHLF